MDFYKNGLDSILETFEKFISNMSDESIVLVNKDCEATMSLHSHKTMTFGLSDADYTAKNIEFKGLLNTVPYFFMWGNVWELWKNMWVDSGDLG